MINIIKLSGEIAQLRYMDVSARRKYAEHSHRTTSYEIILSGSYLKTVHNKPHERRAGRAYLMASNVPHACEYLAPVRSLSLEYLRDQDNLQICQHRIDLISSDQLGASISNVSHSVMREAVQPDSLSSLAIDAYASELLIAVLRRRSTSEDTQEIVWMRRVVERLKDDMSDPASIEELAELARVHPGHLARVFRSQFGVPIATFQRQLRLQSAARALVTNAPTAEIALAAGYSAQSQFITAFKKAFSITPAQYRREHRR